MENITNIEEEEHIDRILDLGDKIYTDSVLKRGDKFLKRDSSMLIESAKAMTITGSALGAGVVGTGASIGAVAVSGAVTGLSGPGICSGLAAIGVGGMVGGAATLALGVILLPTIIILCKSG